jgi:hypothetical protein
MDALSLICLILCVGCATDKNEKFAGIIAVRDPGSEIKLKFCSVGIDLDTPFLSDQSVSNLPEYWFSGISNIF